MYEELVAGIVLGISALEDARKKELSVWVPLSGSVLGVAVRVKQGTVFSMDIWLGVLIGLFFLLIAAASRGRFGIGDGLILITCGICLGWKCQLMLLLLGMLMFLIVGAIGILLGRWFGRKAMAFVPYLWIAFILRYFWRG